VEASNLTVYKRDVPPPGTSANWDDFYLAMKENPNTEELNIDNGVFGTPSAAEIVSFGDRDKNILIREFSGCIAVLVLSHRGKCSISNTQKKCFRNETLQD
jgi:hypothetical protein